MSVLFAVVGKRQASSVEFVFGPRTAPEVDRNQPGPAGCQQDHGSLHESLMYKILLLCAPNVQVSERDTSEYCTSPHTLRRLTLQLARKRYLLAKGSLYIKPPMS
jgi:hypothetical protein